MMVEAEEGLSKAPWKTVRGNVNGKTVRYVKEIHES